MNKEFGFKPDAQGEVDIAVGLIFFDGVPEPKFFDDPTFEASPNFQPQHPKLAPDKYFLADNSDN